MILSQLWEYRLPFRHFRAANVLKPEIYQAIASRFSTMLEANSAGKDSPYRFAPTNANYDARILAIDEALAAAFAPLFSVELIEELHDIFGFPFLPVIDGALHSSPPGSRTGWIHTDLCAAWFDESMRPAGPFLFPRRDRCDYFTGSRKHAAAVPKKYVRAAALLFYLCNEGWVPGDGGETALYGAQEPSWRSSVGHIPPLSNSLLAFECSPHSYHRFMTNPRRVRNSVILWIHATPEVMESRWGLSF
jgi:hypothetical protein